jgi:nitroimidazol reductase NimA-like FMN-containing flavoprotein (pyridoxamine 5'-phosphate oxidase superfamily)
MRRSEFESTDPKDYLEIMSKAFVGHLGLIDPRGYPRIVPLNFVLTNGSIYFHGAQDGEKFDLLKETPKVAFNVDISYSYIPSYWQSDKLASVATQFFKSAHVRGEGSIVTDVNEKAEALQDLMVKHQPEGKFIPIDPSERIYRKEIADVAIYRVEPLEISVKVKFGQTLPRKVLLKIIEKLKERNEGMDSETIVEIKKYW